MEMKSWNESYATGNKVIDAQHKDLLEAFDQLNEAIVAGRGKEILARIFIKLDTYAIEHFDTEENYMRLYNYPDTLVHIDEHLEFKKQIEMYRIKYFDKESTIPTEVFKFMKEWIINHIRFTDRKYIEYLGLDQ